MAVKKVTVPDIVGMKGEGGKIPVLTAYGRSLARILDEAGIPIILVGDSVGMVEAGYSTTLPVTLDEMIYHTRSCASGRKSALLVADMPFGSYQASTRDAVASAVRLVKEGGAEAVKVEGGMRSAGVIRAIVSADIPVMGHVGLTPQSVHRMGGYRVQGKGPASAEAVKAEARAVEEAGAFAVVIEGVPARLASEITAELSIPTIGIGAGPGCDGQVLVINDLLGLDGSSRAPRFVKRYVDLDSVISKAVREYADEVRSGAFPSDEHSY